MNRFFAFFTLMGLGGCISNIDRVAPMSWTYYLGGSARESEIRMALLECGSNVPGDSREFYRPDGKGFLMPRQGLNEIILVGKCMQNAGFSYSGDKETCKRWKDLPACEPDAVIPKRSVANRLNSPFCKLIPKAKICQPDYDPSEVETNTPANPKPISVAPSTNLATKLQDQVQKGSNPLAPSGTSPYFVDATQLQRIQQNPALANDILGLPSGSQGSGFRVYEMQPKPNATPTVYQSDVATATNKAGPTAVGNATQTLVPDRSLWTEPKLTNVKIGGQ